MPRNLTAVAACAILVAAAELRAQIIPIPVGGGNQTVVIEPPEPQPEIQPSLLGPDPMDALRGNMPPGFRGVDRRVPMFQGFPVLAPPPDFGAYPGGALPLPFATGEQPLPLPPVPPRSPNAWPAWFRGDETLDPEGFTVEVGAMAQTTDLVWLRQPADTVYVPLTYYDRYRVIREGSAVEIRGGGQFVCDFHGGAELRVQGRSRLEFDQLDDDAIGIEFSGVERVWLRVGERPGRLVLGKSGTLEATSTSLVLRRDDEFVSCENRGPGTARLLAEGEEHELPSGHRVVLVPIGTDHSPFRREFTMRGGLRSERDGRRLTIEGTEGGTVEWSGARMRLPAGSKLELDPLAGKSFPSRRTN